MCHSDLPEEMISSLRDSLFSSPSDASHQQGAANGGDPDIKNSQTLVLEKDIFSDYHSKRGRK